MLSSILAGGEQRCNLGRDALWAIVLQRHRSARGWYVIDELRLVIASRSCRCVSVPAVIVVFVVALGFALGLIVGRWWTILAAIAAGVWILSRTGVDEVPHWFLGLLYGGCAAIGIALGIALRSRMKRT